MTLIEDRAAPATSTTATLDPDLAAPSVFPSQVASTPRWSLATRLAFRFTTIYASLYILLTQMFGGLFGPVLSLLPEAWVRVPGSAWSVQTTVSWVATRVIGFGTPLQVAPTGSGDKPYDFAFVVTLLFVSAVGTAVWSFVARHREAHPTTYRWFRVFLRFGVGSTMLGYGMVKYFPLQMSYPSLTRLLTPYGNFSHMGVLWSKIGASPAYETFTGLVEISCAVLLFVPGLTTVGALLSFMSSVQIFALNMMYDVPVKLFSLHLIIFSLILLAPDVRRLFTAIVLRRGVSDAPEPPLARRPRLRYALIALQLAFGAWLLTANYLNNRQSWMTFGADAPKPALYGIWDIERMEIDGVERAPLITDYDRWRRMVVQNAFGVSFQRMDDTFQAIGARIDPDAHTITFRRGAGDAAQEVGRFTYDAPEDDRLVLVGEIEGRAYRLETRRRDHDQMELRRAHFRWIQERPYNR